MEAVVYWLCTLLIAALALSMWGRRHIRSAQYPVANTPTQAERTRATPAIPSQRGGHHENGASLGARNNCQWYRAAKHNLDFSSDRGAGWSNGGGDPRLAFAKTEGATLSSDTGVGGSGSYL